LARNVCFPDPATEELLIKSNNDYKAKTHEDSCFDRKSRGTRKDVTVLGSKEK
jgi:hypothetical protein